MGADLERLLLRTNTPQVSADARAEVGTGPQGTRHRVQTQTFQRDLNTSLCFCSYSPDRLKGFL